MKLHNEIMNIQAKPDATRGGMRDCASACKVAYAHGHRDARHAAAELALKYERALEHAMEILKDVAESGSEGDAAYCQAALITIEDILEG